MVGIRRRAFLVLALLFGALAACQPAAPPRPGAGVGERLEWGREYARQLVRYGRGPAELAPSGVIALGYLERLRLGLGSPFRLIDYALHDPRLEQPTRRRLSWALLARTLAGESYEIDPAALDAARTDAELGAAHLELIEGAVTEARDPRGGELAVRLAYALAAAEGSVSDRTEKLAVRTAALIRDRELARADARRLLDAAEDTTASALELLPTWRAERRFRVERPPMRALPREAAREAMRLAPRLARAIRSLGRGVGGAELRPAAVRDESEPLLGVRAARRLAALADSLRAPPQTPVVVAVDVHRRALLDDRPPLDAETRSARERFVERARSEERFAAAYALLRRRSEADPTLAARIALGAAVALRTYAQEEPWFPGMGGPSAGELKSHFGLASVTFGTDVPASWRPYYRRMLERALTDLQRVLPSLDLRGLHIRFGESANGDSALALHDPSTRTIYLPPATGAGTIAHEIAHDLDWQIALGRYNVRGDYGTDRAMRRRHDRLAAWLEGLTSAALIPPTPGGGEPPAHARRPAEVFARSLDWFVVAALAHHGRMNGYLSSVQDEVLTGYGTVQPPDVTGAAGAALVTILDEVAPVYAETRRWFLESYGPGRALSAYGLVRRVLEAPAREGREHAPVLPSTSPVAARLAAVERGRAAASSAIDRWLCRSPGARYVPRLERTRRRLVALAAGARARGIALAFAARIAGDDGRTWMASRFYGAPRPTAAVDSATAALLGAVADRVRTLGRAPLPTGETAFQILDAPRSCTGMLFGTGD